MAIKLDVHVCATYVGTEYFTGHTYTAAFATEVQAVEFIGRKRSYCEFWTREDSPLDEYGVLLDTLYPTCEHGLSEILCMGPDHYPSTEQEMAMTIY